MTQQIIVEKGTGKKMAALFECSGAFVAKALHFKTNSNKAIRIRHCAKKDFGGKEVRY